MSKPVDPIVYLVALDEHPSSDHVLEVATGLAGGLPGRAELHLVYVIGSTPPLAAAAGVAVISPEDLLESARALLDRHCAAATSRFGGSVTGHIVAGEPWREIVQLSAHLHADLIILGTAGKTGVARAALGSVAESVVRHAGCPVLVARPKDHQQPAVPEIEPPCPKCVEVQRATSRATLWCDRHSEHHVRGRLHYETPPTFALGSMLLRP